MDDSKIMFFLSYTTRNDLFKNYTQNGNEYIAVSLSQKVNDLTFKIQSKVIKDNTGKGILILFKDKFEDYYIKPFKKQNFGHKLLPKFK